MTAWVQLVQFYKRVNSENESVRIKNRLQLSWHQVHSSDKNHPSTQKYSLIITITAGPILQCFACINPGSSPLPFHNMFYQVHFTDREEAQKHFPAQIQASYPTAEPGFKPGSAVQPLHAYPARYSEMSTSSSWLSPVTAWGVTAVWAWSLRLHTRRHIWLANLSQFLKIQWCEDYSKGILKLLHSLKADKALSIYSSYLHLLVLYEMIQNPIFLQYSANRPYKEKLDRKLPVDRGPVSPTDALSFHRPGRNNDRRQKAPSPGEASLLLRHAFKRLPSPCIPRHPAGGCSGPGDLTARGLQASSVSSEPEAYTNASPWTPGDPPDVPAPSAPDAMRDWSELSERSAGSQWLREATPSP